MGDLWAGANIKYTQPFICLLVKYMTNKKNKATDKELEALQNMAEPHSKESLAILGNALQSSKALTVTRAAHVIKEHRLEGLHRELLKAFDRFFQEPIKQDPGCLARLAVLEALDFTEYDDPAPFLTAVHYVQEEKAWGPPVDTATGLRARSIVALARLNDAGLSLVAAELLVDKEAPVRQAAVDALTMSGDKNNAALLLFKLRSGDKEPLVTMSCMSGLLALLPEKALSILSLLLCEKDEALREMAAITLGESKRDDALSLLLQNLEGLVLPKERSVIFRALGLHRSERALQVLLSVVSEGSTVDAKVAVESLGARRFEHEILEKVRAAAQKNKKAKLADVITQTFSIET
jgi:HEAT repeat protein